MMFVLIRIIEAILITLNIASYTEDKTDMHISFLN